MKAPAAPGTPIDAARRRRWVQEFGAYKSGVIEQSVVDWVEQFDAGDRDLAGRVLDVVDFYAIPRIETAFRDVLKSLPGWTGYETSIRTPGWSIDAPGPKWRFCEFSAGPATSASDMLYRFKYANHLTGSQLRGLFIGRSEILSSRLGAEDTLVLIDDFVGTGLQATEAFEQFFGELIASVGRVYLVTVVARSEAIEAVLKETGIEVRSAQILLPGDSPISEACPHFTAEEKAKLIEYGVRADKHRPRGYGDCGLVVVFYHNCPNNSLPMLHAGGRGWTPLFPRHT